MDLAKVLQQLHLELENLNAAIASLERLQEAGKHRGKEAEWLGDIGLAVPAGRKRKGKSKQNDDAPQAEQGAGTAGKGE